MKLLEMEQKFLRILFLNGLSPLAGERTMQAFYYILRGRKANQTLQDVHFFRLYPYYRLFSRLSKERWEEIVADLRQHAYIAWQPLRGDERKSSYLITEKGKEALRAGREEYRLEEWLEPLQEAGSIERGSFFWLRLHLMVQTVSHLLYRTGFFPIVQQKQARDWVKAKLADKRSRAKWLDGLGEELAMLLESLPIPLQQLVVKQLSGQTQAGLTLAQLAQEFGQAPSFLQLQMYHCLARMYREIEGNPKKFLLLQNLLDGQGENHQGISASAKETYRLLQRNYKTEEIARMRNLRFNTVEDHLVEIALHDPDWDISAFLPYSVKADIIEASERLETRRLRLLKDYLGESYSYLQIRLALARWRGESDDV